MRVLALPLLKITYESKVEPSKDAACPAFSLVFAFLLSCLADLAFPSRMFLWSLSSFSLVMPTLLGWVGTHGDSCALSLPPCTPGPLYQSAGLCGVLANLNFTILLSRHKMNVILPSQLFGKKESHCPSECEKVPWKYHFPLARSQSKGLEAYCGTCLSSNGREKEEVCTWHLVLYILFSFLKSHS